MVPKVRIQADRILIVSLFPRSGLCSVPGPYRLHTGFKRETFDTAISDIKAMTNCFGLSSTPQTLNTFRILTLSPLTLFCLI